MNIAFSTLIIFILLIPGLTFLRFYYSEEFSKEYFKTSPFEVISFSLLPTILLHALFGFIVWCIPWCYIDFKVLGLLLSGSNDNNELLKAYKSVQDNILSICIYNFSLWALSALLGRQSKQWVRSKGLDRKHKLLRFQNYWHYLLTGEILDFPRVPVARNKPEIDFTFIDALIEMSDRGIIYTGILADYQLTKTGEGIDTITLLEVRRRYLKKDKEDKKSRESENTYYEMPGEFFVLRYDRIINLNVTYYSIEKTHPVNSS